MYAWIWRHLPGRTPVRALVATVLVAAVVAVLFLAVFPWAEPLLPFTNVTVDSTSTSSPGPGTSSPTTVPTAGLPQ